MPNPTGVGDDAKFSDQQQPSLEENTRARRRV